MTNKEVMKSVLISIKPKWCNLIASGKKTIEVRKTKPKLDTPFKCYIYCTLDKNDRFICRGGDDMPFDVGNGMVIGEFVCDKIYDFKMKYLGKFSFDEDCCLSFDEMNSYLGDKNGYGWHISNLKIYDKPKELYEFEKPCPRNKECLYCKYHYEGGMFEPPSCNWEDFGITRPPQSWCYVEDVEV